MFVLLTTSVDLLATSAANWARRTFAYAPVNVVPFHSVEVGRSNADEDRTSSEFSSLTAEHHLNERNASLSQSAEAAPKSSSASGIASESVPDVSRHEVVREMIPSPAALALHSESNIGLVAHTESADTLSLQRELYEQATVVQDLRRENELLNRKIRSLGYDIEVNECFMATDKFKLEKNEKVIQELENQLQDLRDFVDILLSSSSLQPRAGDVPSLGRGVHKNQNNIPDDGYSIPATPEFSSLFGAGSHFECSTPIVSDAYKVPIKPVTNDVATMTESLVSGGTAPLQLISGHEMDLEKKMIEMDPSSGCDRQTSLTLESAVPEETQKYATSSESNADQATSAPEASIHKRRRCTVM